MRNLMMPDVYKMSRILGKMNLKLEVKGKAQEEIGADLIVKIAENLHLAEKEINEFLGGLVGITGEQFGALELREAAKHIQEFKALDGVTDFLKLAAQSMK